MIAHRWGLRQPKNHSCRVKTDAKWRQVTRLLVLPQNSETQDIVPTKIDAFWRVAYRTKRMSCLIVNH